MREIERVYCEYKSFLGFSLFVFWVRRVCMNVDDARNVCTRHLCACVCDYLSVIVVVPFCVGHTRNQRRGEHLRKEGGTNGRSDEAHVTGESDY